MAGIAHQLCLRQMRLVVSAADGLTAAMKQVLSENQSTDKWGHYELSQKCHRAGS